MPSLTPQDIIASYRAYAPFYDRLFGRVLEPGRVLLAQQVALRNPARLLELGVGTGLMLPLYPKGCEVCGVDLSEEMLGTARKRAAVLNANGHQISLTCANAEDLALPEEGFDCVTLPYVLSVTPDPAGLLRQARRLCRQGGHILILNHFSGSRFWWLLERLIAPVARRVGFRSEFRYEEHMGPLQHSVESVMGVNLMGLSKLVVIRNDAPD